MPVPRALIVLTLLIALAFAAREAFGPRDAGPPGDVAASLVALEQQWDTIRVQADTVRLGRLLAPEYLRTDARGATSGRDVELRRAAQRLATGAPTVTHAALDDVRVTRYGPGAVVTFLASDGTRRWRGTHVFVWREGRWVVVADQETALPDATLPAEPAAPSAPPPG